MQFKLLKKAHFQKVLISSLSKSFHVEMSHLKCKYFFYSSRVLSLCILYVNKLVTKVHTIVPFCIHMAHRRVKGFSFLLFVTRQVHSACVCMCVCVQESVFIL